MADRVNVDLEGVRDVLEALAGGASLSAFGSQLIKEALFARLYKLTIAEIIDLLDPVSLSVKANIDRDRMFDLAVGEFPNNAEIVKLARVLKQVGLNSKVLSEIRDRSFPSRSHLPESPHCHEHEGASCG